MNLSNKPLLFDSLLVIDLFIIRSGDNIIGAPKIFKIFVAIKLLIFQYCDINIGLFSILIYFWYQFFAFFLYCSLYSYCSSLLLKVMAINISLHFVIAFEREKERQLYISEAIQKRSHKPMHKMKQRDSKLHYWKSNRYIMEPIEKVQHWYSNIDKKLKFYGVPKIVSLFWCTSNIFGWLSIIIRRVIW